MTAIDLSIASLRRRYAEGLSPVALVESLLPRLEAPDRHNVWITRLSRAALLARARALDAADRSRLPLYGIPFAIKDNIDLEGVPTTAACPDFAYQPERSATVVQRLLDAGAIALGKANLDQFATGLVGARSPYGPGRNSFDPAFVSGGSSSGSALAVAMGLASFSLGTDTAGSGRVPAAFNNLVGHKPTLGLLSARGVVPACRSLDTISIFALCAADAQRVLAVAAGFDAEDGYSREAQPSGFDFGAGASLRFGVPRDADLEFFGDEDSAHLFRAAVERLRRLGGEAVEFDLRPFLEAARLLYEGPWVAERYAAIRAFYDEKPGSLHPVTRGIVERSRAWLAADAYAAQYRLRDLAREAGALWSRVDCALTPTAGTCYAIAAVEADPIRLNSNLGHYTNFMNLLDLSATSVPAGFGRGGLPFGVTLFAPAHRDIPLLHLADRMQRDALPTAGAVGTPLPPPEDELPVHVGTGQVRVAVCGAHLSGLPLNGQLTSRGARRVAVVRSAPCYRFYALPGGPPERPGMVRVAEGGGAVEMEIWELPAAQFGSFVAGIPAPLGIGTVLLEGGGSVQGFVCEAAAVEGARDITALGGWRTWLASKPA